MKRPILLLVLTLVVVTIITFLLSPRAQAGPYNHEIKYSYECANVKEQSSYIRCFREDNNLVFVFKDTKKDDAIKYREYLVVDILEDFRGAGGTSFKIITDDKIKYKKCVFFSGPSFGFNCNLKDLDERVSF